MIHLNHMLEATNGVLIYPGKQHHFDAFSHDTRQLIPGEMFVAVRGEQGDGHDYLLDAVHRGAAGLLLEAQFLTTLAEGSRATLERAGVATISVPDTRVALQQYASFILQRWHPTVIAVTGSTGKTSTKEAIASVLASTFATFKSWQNYNDLLGLPLSLGRLEEHHEYAVLELGCDHPGEISDLCRICRPRIGVLTNISPTQLQYFGTLERLASELGTLLTSLPQDGLAIVNGDDAQIQPLTAQCVAPITTFSPSAAHNVQVTWEGTTAVGAQFIAPNSRPTINQEANEPGAINRNPIPLSTTNKPDAINCVPTAYLLGAHHVSTLLAAYAVGRACGLQVDEIQQALANLRPLPGRLNPLPGIDGSMLLDDTHNANPASVIAGLETLKALPTHYRIAVLGDMLRLGDYEEEAHRLVGRKAATCVDFLVTRGERAALIAEAAKEADLAAERVVITSTHEDAAQAVRQIIEQHVETPLLLPLPTGNVDVLGTGSPLSEVDFFGETPWEETPSRRGKGRGEVERGPSCSPCPQAMWPPAGGERESRGEGQGHGGPPPGPPQGPPPLPTPLPPLRDPQWRSKNLPLKADSPTDAVPTATILIKGSEETRMERVTEMLMARPEQAREQLVRQTPGWKQIVVMRADRPTWVEIDLSAIANNTRQIKSLVGPQVRILASLKADAYGHGATKVARTVLHNGASMLGVATASEAMPLRNAGIQAPILIFGYVPPWQMREAVRLGLTVTLYAVESAQALSRAAQALGQTVKVHVKVDTGMGRLGIRAEQVEEVLTLVREIMELPGLELEGIFTHFAMADTHDLTHARLQLSRFQHVLQVLERHLLRPPLVHAANSAALLSLPEAHFDMVRPGIALYGLDPSAEVPMPEGFRAALSFKTQVAQVKTIPAGEGISYGCTYITEEPTRVAVLPVGYADGFRRAPSNWGTVLLHGQEVPILGRVCMDQCMVDVSHVPQARVGDEVVLIGRQGRATLTAEQVAQRLGTSNYEVVSAILARVPRVD